MRVTKELADAIYEDLIQNGYVRRGELTDKYYTDKQNGTVQVAAEVQDCAASVVRVLSSIFDGRSILPEDANGGNVEAHLEVLARILVLVRRTDNDEHVLLGRERNRANHSCARVRHRFDDLLRRLVDDLMVIGLKPDADFLSRHCLPPFLAIR